MDDFRPLMVREIEDALEHDPDGLIYPIPGNSANAILFEARDGDDVEVVPAKAVALQLLNDGQTRKLASVADVKINLVITDARVAFACSKFDKGGGWVGGVSSMIVLNSVSKARAAFRRRGKMLVGQVRYPWLGAVGGSEKRGWGDEERLRLVTPRPDGSKFLIDVTLPKNIDAPEVAAEIARRAARYLGGRATGTGADLSELSNATRLDSEKGKFAHHQFPAPVPADESSARL
jgi:hypothetical protein